MEKKLSETVNEVTEAYPNAEVKVWAEDEHRIGLHPVNRRQWTPGEEVPIAPVNWKYVWSWLAGFVEPSSGEPYWWIIPKVNGYVFEQMLTDFAAHFGLGEKKRVILVVDQAAFHTTDKVEVPEGIHLLFLPPKSPELQPAERLWPIANEAIANESFATLDELEDRMVQRCQVLMKRQEFVRGLTGFYWWLEAVA